jgi:hypothetical protein
MQLHYCGLIGKPQLVVYPNRDNSMDGNTIPQTKQRKSIIHCNGGSLELYVDSRLINKMRKALTIRVV